MKLKFNILNKEIPAFGGFIKMHEEEKCCGVVRTGLVMTEPMPNINDAKITYTKTDKLQVVSLPKEVEKLKEIVDDINNISSYYVITTTKKRAEALLMLQKVYLFIRLFFYL